MQQQQKFFTRMEARFQCADWLCQQFVAAPSGDSIEAGSPVLDGGTSSARANSPQKDSEAVSGPVSSRSTSPAPAAAGAGLHSQLTDNDAGAQTSRAGQYNSCCGSSSNSQHVISASTSSVDIQMSIPPLIVHVSAVAAIGNDSEVVETASGMAGSLSTPLAGHLALMAAPADLESISTRLVEMPDDYAEHLQVESLEQFGLA